MPGTAAPPHLVSRRLAGKTLLSAALPLVIPLAIPAGAALAQEVPAMSQSEAAVTIEALELLTLSLVNGARLQHGVAPLELDGAMAGAARSHAADMMRHNFIAHTGSDGSSPQQRLRRAGVEFRWGSENIWSYWGRVPEQGPGVMHAAMMAERHAPDLWNHIRNILHGGYRRIGVGIVTSPRGVQYLSEKFAD